MTIKKLTLSLLLFSVPSAPNTSVPPPNMTNSYPYPYGINAGYIPQHHIPPFVGGPMGPPAYFPPRAPYPYSNDPYWREDRGYPAYPSHPPEMMGYQPPGYPPPPYGAFPPTYPGHNNYPSYPPNFMQPPDQQTSKLPQWVDSKDPHAPTIT